jgi:hypothetical protein
VNLEEKKSSVLNAETQPYTMQDIISTIGTTQGYKEFSGRIFQGSILQPITLTVFKNDFNQLPTVLNDFGSPYDFVISLENQFPQNKTSVKTNVERENIIVSYPDSADNSTVYFNSFDFAGEQAAPTSFTFEIRVYN